MMRHLLSVFALCAISAAFQSHDAMALTTSTTSLTCSSTKKLQAAIDAVTAGTVATINVSGTCNENITVPRAKTIIIKGATATAKITAANNGLPALISKGDTTIQGMILTNAAGTAEAVVETDKGGSLDVISSDLSAPNVETLVAAWFGTVRVINSRLVGGANAALEVWGSSDLHVVADPTYTAGPTGKFETYIKSAGDGISCGAGGTLNIRSKISNASNGIITIEQSGNGISSSNCVLTIANRSSQNSSLQITSNQNGIWASQSRIAISNILIANSIGSGVELSSSDLDIDKSEVSGNGVGLYAEQSNIKIGAVLFNNTNSDLQAGTMSSVKIYDWQGQSSFPKALAWTNSFSCNNGSRVDIDPNSLVQTLGTQYDFLGCLYQH